MEGGYGERGRKRCRKNDIAQGGNEVENERECGSNYGGWCIPNNKYIEVFDRLMFPYSYYFVSLYLRMEL